MHEDVQIYTGVDARVTRSLRVKIYARLDVGDIVSYTLTAMRNERPSMPNSPRDAQS